MQNETSKRPRRSECRRSIYTHGWLSLVWRLQNRTAAEASIRRAKPQLYRADACNRSLRSPHRPLSLGAAQMIAIIAAQLWMWGCSATSSDGTKLPVLPPSLSAGTYMTGAAGAGTSVVGASVAGASSATNAPGGAAASGNATPGAPTATAPNSNNGAAAPPGAGAGPAAGGPNNMPGRTVVTGPITNGRQSGFLGSPFDASGRVQQEYFFEGDATSYTSQGTAADGKITAMPAGTAHFKSRILVSRPMDPNAFNGTLIVEWFNVTAGYDNAPGYTYNSEEIVREGYAYAAVSAQKQGVEGGGSSILPNPPPALKMADPGRYGSLVHPGDSYSYDIYTQAAQVLRQPGDVDMLAGLKPARIIAYGESQSAARLVTYIAAVHALAKAYDGFFVHSRGAAGAGLSDTGFGGGGGAIPNLTEPVFQFQTETDALGSFGTRIARQPDTDRLRTWEVAGTAHADSRLDAVSCPGGNTGPGHFVAKAGLHALNLWLKDKTPPPIGAVLMADQSGNPVTDAHGNTLGGIRTPAVDVPIATLSGQPMANASVLCRLFGSTTPFTPEVLKQLYPTHDDYVSKVKTAAASARADGFILPQEEATMVSNASASAIPPP